MATGETKKLQFSEGVSVSAPSAIVAPVTNTQSLTVTDNMTTPGSWTGNYRRIGDCIEFWINCGSFTAEAGSDTDDYKIDLLTGLGVSWLSGFSNAHSVAMGYMRFSSSGSTADGAQSHGYISCSLSGSKDIIIRMQDAGVDSSFTTTSLNKGQVGPGAPDGMSVSSMYLHGCLPIDDWQI